MPAVFAEHLLSAPAVNFPNQLTGSTYRINFPDQLDAYAGPTELLTRIPTTVTVRNAYALSA